MTVGPGISPDLLDPWPLAEALAGYNRRWGITPRPENGATWPASRGFVNADSFQMLATGGALALDAGAMSAQPILYSFRRCPYAMRARLAIASADIKVELREILLRNKAPEFVAVSPKATVPVLVAGEVIEESYDIMLWALARNDPEGLLPQDVAATTAHVEALETQFKTHLDRTKYHSRYPDCDREEERALAAAYLAELDTRLSPNLGGDRLSLADLATLPFIRQFAFIDKAWFDAQPWANIHQWLENFLASDRFSSIMAKNETWQAGDAPVWFP